jgi:hypothetical protein
MAVYSFSDVVEVTTGCVCVPVGTVDELPAVRAVGIAVMAVSERVVHTSSDDTLHHMTVNRRYPCLRTRKAMTSCHRYNSA